MAAIGLVVFFLIAVTFGLIWDLTRPAPSEASACETSASGPSRTFRAARATPAI